MSIVIVVTFQVYTAMFQFHDYGRKSNFWGFTLDLDY